MDAIEIDNLIPTEGNVQRSVKCPICLEVMTGPVAQCNAGHAICSGCKPGLQSCPLCNQPFSSLGPTMMSQHTVLDVIPKKCCYRVSGCPAIMSPDGDHELYCPYRITQCLKCQWSGKVKDLAGHVRKNHPRSFVDLNHFYTRNSIDLAFEDFRSLKLGCCLIAIFNQLFWICFKEDVTTKQILAQSVWVPNAKPSSMVYAVMKLKNNHAVFKHTMKCSYAALDTQNDENAYKMSLPCSLVFGLGEESTRLKVNVAFLRENAKKRLDIWLILRVLLIIFLLIWFFKAVDSRRFSTKTVIHEHRKY